MEDLYRNIKERRLALGMSQQELAEKTGYTSRTSIAKIEAGHVRLTSEKIMQFANALNIMYSELMGWTYDKNGVPSYERNTRTADELANIISRGEYTAGELAKIIAVASEKLNGMMANN